MVGLIIGGVVLVVIILWFIITGNKINKAELKIEESFSGIDAALAKRYDALNKMVEVAKGYMKHEKETLFGVVNLRKNMSIAEANEANRIMNENYSKINALAESYPDLKANDQFIILQKAILDVEENLQAARRLYNANVTSFNQYLITFPSSIVAKSKGKVRKEFFVIDDVAKRNDIKIEF